MTFKTETLFFVYLLFLTLLLAEDIALTKNITYSYRCIIMEHNRLVWLEALPMGTKIKGWTIDGGMSITGHWSMYTVHKKEQRAIMKYVSNFFQTKRTFKQ